MQSVALMLKRTFWGIFLCLALLSFPLPSFAVTVQDVPNPRQVYGGWVTDMANLLDPETEAKLNQMISKLEAENGTEIAVVTVPDTAPSATSKQFATQLFKYWGIGKRGINNGVLFLISQDERRVEIETGYGIEKILPNTQVDDIINQQIIPHFKQGDFAGGILAGTKALIVNLEGRVLSNSEVFVVRGLYGIGIVLCLSPFLVTILGSSTGGFGGGDGGSWGSDSGGSWGGSDSGSFGGGDSGGGGDGGGW
jgi:uncharacterized protein